MRSWEMGRAAYYADFVTTPAMAIGAGSVQLAYGERNVLAIAGLLAGYLLWTLAEYFIHRFVFHRTYRREHWAHHLHPTDYVGVQPWQTLGIFLFAIFALNAAFGATFGAAAAVGLLLGYLSYIVVHDRIHHEPEARWSRSFWRRPREAHMLHHGGIELNFGIVHPLWDIVFRTYHPTSAA